MSRLRAIAGLFSHATLAFLFCAAAGWLAVAATPAPDLARFEQRSQLVEAGGGEPIWGFLSKDGQWRLSARPDDVDPKYLQLLLSYEDRRFFAHPGVDALALARASWDALRLGRSVSGGSTLTMQAVRLLEPKPRTLLAKLEQILKALKLERMMTKPRILEIYLTLAPFGGNVDGVRAASLLYFGKDPRRLEWSEAALLVAVPQAPEARRPDRAPQAARAARDRIVAALAARRALTPEQARLARMETGLGGHRVFAAAAPHFALRVRARSAGVEEILPTMLEFGLQRQIEALVTTALGKWEDAVNIAVVVLRNADASIAAYVGGAEFGSLARSGYIDLSQALRSPGSALKPFIYAAAFDQLLVHPDTIVNDCPIQIDGYRPDNADGQYMGDLTIRQALVRSRNTTAVLLLKKLGVANLLDRFRAVGGPLTLPASDPSGGLATALGGEGVRLEQLAWFYTSLMRDGKLGSLRLTPSDPAETVGALMSAPAARAVADILADAPPPAGFERLAAEDGGRRLGYKTGTSYGFRDAWAVGFDRLHTVAVWVGRPDGAAHLGAYGVTAAAPLMMQIFEALPSPAAGIRFSAEELGPLATVHPLPPRLARFGGEAAAALSVFFPHNGATIESGKPTPAPVDLTLTAEGGKPPYRWRIDGLPPVTTEVPTAKWSFSARGQFDLRVEDASGGVAHSSFWLN